jgi:hypothetical protein
LSCFFFKSFFFDLNKLMQQATAKLAPVLGDAVSLQYALAFVIAVAEIGRLHSLMAGRRHGCPYLSPIRFCSCRAAVAVFGTIVVKVTDNVIVEL